MNLKSIRYTAKMIRCYCSFSAVALLCQRWCNSYSLQLIHAAARTVHYSNTQQNCLLVDCPYRDFIIGISHIKTNDFLDYKIGAHKRDYFDNL
jgi:hypothetical protein